MRTDALLERFFVAQLSFNTPEERKRTPIIIQVYSNSGPVDGASLFSR